MSKTLKSLKFSFYLLKLRINKHLATYFFKRYVKKALIERGKTQ